MINFRNSALALALGLAVFAAGSPAFAKSAVHNPGHAAHAQALDADVGDGSLTPDRAEALRECNEIAAPFRQYTWGVYQGYKLRACMNEHGQVE